jgi:ABC-type sugar transport system ATPase subunit
LFQFYALYPTLTVRENLAYPLHADQLDTRASKSVRRVSGMLHLDPVLNKRLSQPPR